jgi:hypothetical protein
MHHLMLITISMSPGATSEDARCRAYSRLLEDDSFCRDGGGRFGSPVCDWFVIGGRWSGFIQETLLGDAYQAAFTKEFPDMASGYFAARLVDEHRDALNQLWRQFNGLSDNPLTRSSYDELGCDDDAMLVDQALYGHFLKPLAGKSTCLDATSPHDFADLDDEPVGESFIGRKWLIVVDYHN